jgi:transposase
MPASVKKQDPKAETLRELGTLNPHPEDVRDPAFIGSDFFDPRDLVQVKYEMLRRVRTDDYSVTEAAAHFGFSRPTWYVAKSSFEREGLAGLLPRKRGPRRPHKLTDEVMSFVEDERVREPDLRISDLVMRIEARFGRRVHPRSLERALARREKKRR